MKLFTVAERLPLQRQVLLGLAAMLVTLAPIAAQSNSDEKPAPKDQLDKQESPQPKKPPAPQKLGALAGLQEMLAVALRHNPDVRVAEANVRSAEVELDRVRLEVVQKIIAFRQRWQTQLSAVRQAEIEVAEFERIAQLARRGVITERELLAASQAPEKLALQKTRLSEIEAELPFLLGQVPGQEAAPPVSEATRLIRDMALPKARQIFELRQRAHGEGSATLLEVTDAHRQVLEWEALLADTKTKKIAVLEQHRNLLEKMRDMAKIRHGAGEAPITDVLAAELEIAKLELQIIKLRGE